MVFSAMRCSFTPALANRGDRGMQPRAVEPYHIAAFPKYTVLPMPTRPSSSRRFRVGRSKTGLGLFAVKPIKKGELIAYYRGRIISNEEADKLWTKYLFELNGRWTVDGS